MRARRNEMCLKKIKNKAEDNQNMAGKNYIALTRSSNETGIMTLRALRPLDPLISFLRALCLQNYKRE